MYNYTIAKEVKINTSSVTRKFYEEGPNWTHDCESCKYLGYIIEQDNYGEVLSPEHDVYLHGGAFIIRHSSDGPDYRSMELSFLEAWAPGEVQGSPMSELWRCAYNLYRRTTP